MEKEIKGDIIHIPFSFRTKNEIRKVREWAKQNYPNQKYKYIKPRWVEMNNSDHSFWTYPEIEITIVNI